MHPSSGAEPMNSFGTSSNDIKTQLICREGVYRLVPQAEYCRPKITSYSGQASSTLANNSLVPPVRVSFTHCIQNSYGTSMNNHQQYRFVGSTTTPNENGSLTSPSHPNGLPNNKNGEEDLSFNVYSSLNNYETNGSFPMVLNGSRDGQRASTKFTEDQLKERICFNVGRELFIYTFQGVQTADLSKLIDRKTYKSTSPTFHDFCTFVDQRISMLLIGFTHGQIQLIDMYRSEINKFYNQERLIDKTKVTCIRWLPRSKSNFLVSYASGQIYLYKEDLPCFTTTPTYQQFKFGDGFVIYTCKTKTTRNPIFRWSIGYGNNCGVGAGGGDGGLIGASSIHEFAFSPCGEYLAVVSQDGFLRVFHYDRMELVGKMRSYFGGLLCVGWSFDSKFIATGGEDDLLTVWSLADKRVIARGQGHKSWINSVNFDPYMTQTTSDLEHEDFLEMEQESSDKSIIDEPIDDRRTRFRMPHRDNEMINKMMTSYRIGSVGQDTQICLWDLTDDIIQQSNLIKSRSKSINNNLSADLSKPNGTASSLNMMNFKSSNHVTSDLNSQFATVDHHHHHNHHHHHLFNSLLKSSHKKTFSLNSKSFLDKTLSKSSFSQSKSTMNDENSTIFSHHLLTNNNGLSDSSRLLGTDVCPRLNEVPLLEPHICKKISHERLTSLVFKKDHILVANHDGKVSIFSRPNSDYKTSALSASLASDMNDIGTASSVCEDIDS